MKKRNLIIISLIGFVFLLSGCSFNLKEIDDKIGDGLDTFNDNKKDELVNIMDKELKFDNKINSPVNKKSKDLSSEKKELINKWLEDEGYNRYGDSKDTMYAGGTPLFNEATGESIDRFDYIIEKHPEVLELF